MTINIWGFLTVAVILGILFAMFAMYLGHKKALKQMEIDAQENKFEKLQQYE